MKQKTLTLFSAAVIERMGAIAAFGVQHTAQIHHGGDVGLVPGRTNGNGAQLPLGKPCPVVSACAGTADPTLIMNVLHPPQTSSARALRGRDALDPALSRPLEAGALGAGRRHGHRPPGSTP
jgi:hypothetical protein